MPNGAESEFSPYSATFRNREGEMDLDKTIKQVRKRYGVDVSVREDERSVFLSGECDKWSDVVAIGKMFVTEGKHVVNDIALKGYVAPAERLPARTGPSGPP